MSLIEKAKADTKWILTNTDHFGGAVTVINPSGASLPLTGITNDIGQVIDVDTGQTLSGRLASAALPLSDVAPLGIPYGVHDPALKPWLVTFNGVTLKIVETVPDRTVDLLLCYLEVYNV
jgi:hypothetical protein